MGSNKDNLHAGHRERVRERFMNCGLDAFADHEVLEFLLFYCVSRRDTNETAHKLLKEFGSFKEIFAASREELINRGGLSEKEGLFLDFVGKVFKRVDVKKVDKKVKMSNPADVCRYLDGLLRGEKRERFYAVALDSASNFIAAELIAKGIADGVFASPRLVAEFALKNNASRVIISHNHPSGDVRPSEDDFDTTVAVAKALTAVGVELTDHIIIGDGDYFSFNSKGIVKNILSDIGA